MPGLTIRGHGAAPNDRGAAAVDKRNETFLRVGSYYIVYTGNTKDSVLQTDSDGTIRFDRELAKAVCSGQSSFGKAMTREELLQSLDAKLEENKQLYGKTEADWISV